MFSKSSFNFLLLLPILCHILPSASDSTMKPDNGELASCSSTPWTPGYLEKEKGEYDGNQIYYGQDGTCGILDGNGNYVKPTMDFMANMGHHCLKFFHNENFGPICGDPAYPYVKHCAMVKFFGNKNPEESQVVCEDAKDMLLVLLEGCAVCDEPFNGNAVNMDLSLSHTWPAGSFFTKCSEQEWKSSKMEARFRTVNNKRMFSQDAAHYQKDGQGASFVLPAIFYQRICDGLFSADAMHESYNDIKLIVKHNCGSGGQFTVKLPELVTADFKKEQNIAEMRGLWLDLGTGQARLVDRPNKTYVEELSWGNWVVEKEVLDANAFGGDNNGES